jgi:hypothetical protein
MALGIVTDTDFEKELNNSSHTTKTVMTDIPPRASNSEVIIPTIVENPSVGRTPDVSNVPQSLRKILAETHAVEGLGRAQELANSLIPGGISQPTLSTYGNGQISRGNHKSSESNDLLNYVNGRKTKITKRALNKINLAMSLMDEDKLNSCDAKELSAITKDMAQVVKHMEPEQREDRKSEPVQFIMYAPQVRTENNYDVVVAKDNY